MIGVLSSAALGFGRDEERAELKIDRRDKKLAAPSDMVVVELIERLFADRWPTQGNEDVALFISSSKNISSALAARWLASNASSNGGGTATGEGKIDFGLDFSPSVTISGLPNLDGYLASRTLGMAGHVDHIACDPWSDLASLMLAYQAVQLGDATRAAVVGVHVDQERDADLLMQRATKREDVLGDPRSGGFGVLVGEVTQGGRSLTRPFLSVNASPDVKRSIVGDWLDSVAGVDTMIVMSAAEGPWLEPAGDKASVVKHIPTHGKALDAIGCLVEQLASDGSFGLLVDVGSAVGGVAVR